MIGKLHRVGLPFSNVVANGVATNLITPGKTLETLRLRLGGTAFAKANIGNIKIKANGKAIIDATGPQIEAINAYRGHKANAAFLDIPFSDFSGNNEFDRHVTALDTSVGLQNLTTEITIAGATAPTLKPILIESGQQKQRSGAYEPYAPLMGKLLSYPFTMATGGKLPFTVPFGPQNGSIIKRVHIFHTGNMTAAEVKMDGVVLYEAEAAEARYEQELHGRVPQNNVYTIDFVGDGSVSKALDTRSAKSLEWMFTFSAADNGVAIVEYIDPLSNL